MSRERTATLTVATLTPRSVVTAVRAMQANWRTAVRMVGHQVTTRRALGGKRGHCNIGAVHGGESDDPILALMRHLDLPVTREDYLKRSGIISGTYRDRFASRVITGAASCPSRLTLASVTTMARRCPRGGRWL
jgi:hypothetical protein